MLCQYIQGQPESTRQIFLCHPDGATSNFLRPQFLHESVIRNFKRVRNRRDAIEYLAKVQVAFTGEIAIGTRGVDKPFFRRRDLPPGITEMNEVKPFARKVLKQKFQG